MKKCTDLNSVKEVAGCLLYTDVHKVENYPFLVKHPFTDSAFATIVKNPEKVTENKVINILESESNLNRWREYVAEQIDSADSADEIYCRITKPYSPNSRRNYPIRDEKRLKQAIFSKKT